MSERSYPEPTKPVAGIRALPPTTVRKIGATQVLVDPSSVVKELIDNALDARSTSVWVNITANTIDSIEVKDSGHGIPAQDRALVCRRYCTSKIRDFDDLKEVGGKWLGFRGEAMASMAEMSGALFVSTRVEGEPVAVLLKFGGDGELATTQRASHPVGTTVKVTDFFNTFPVRKQDGLKNSAKHLAKIKRLMQAYALARPTVRFQLRVLKAKHEKGNFNYAPKTGANVEDAAFKVAGRECASQCDWTAIESDYYEVHAFLPKPNAVGTKIANEGSFISIDSRPVSSSRGTPKKVVAHFKDRLRKANPTLASVKDPFLCMNIICPPDSYDPNIEPAKDDVMFDNEGLVLGLVDKLFKCYYPEVAEEVPEPPTSAQRSPEIDQQESFFTPSTILEDGSQEFEQWPTPAAPKEQPLWRSNMYGIDKEDLDLLSQNQLPVIEEEEEGRRAADVSNPWTIARMNTSTKKRRPVGNLQLPSPAQSQGDIKIGSSSPLPTAPWQALPVVQPLTPRTVSQLNMSQFSVDEELMRSIEHVPRPCARDEPLDEEVSLLQIRRQTSEQPSEARGLPSSPIPPFPGIDLPSIGSNQSDNFSSRRQPPSGTPLHMIPEAPTAPRRSQRKIQPLKNKPFTSPVRETEDLWFGQPMRGPPASTSSRLRRTPRSNAPPLSRTETGLKGLRGPVLNAAERLDDGLTPENNTDISDFLGQKRPHQRSRSLESMPASYFTPINPQARHTGGCQSVHADLDATPYGSLTEHDVREQLRAHTERETSMTSRPRSAPRDGPTMGQHHDPPSFESCHRLHVTSGPSHPIRRRTTDHLHRTWSSKLPLERIPDGQHMQKLILSLSATVPAIIESSRKLDMSRSSIEWGYPAVDAYDAFAVPVTEGKLWEWAEKVDGFLDQWFEREAGVDVVQQLQKGIMRIVDERCKEEEEVDDDDEMLLV